MAKRALNIHIVMDEETIAAFKRITEENNTTEADVLSDFIKDYIVSFGHPETVVNRWPWNKNSQAQILETLLSET